MNKRKPRIIQDKKQRGEWAESVFVARASEQGLPVSKPWGDSRSFDFVVGSAGRFVSVQVKSTTCRLETGYECTLRSGQHKPYRARAFDFLAAYVVPDDAWYIIPAKLVRGKESITLYPECATSKYEPYREAWHLLREATASEEEPNGEAEAGAEESRAEEPAAVPPSSAVGRMQASMNYFKRYLERGGVVPQKPSDDA